MQSTSLALISCEQTRHTSHYPEVPRYDAIIYCDLGIEPVWVPEQVKFIEAACKDAGIPFYILRSDLYRDYMKNFGANRVSAMPFWTLNEDGKEGCIQRRACTVDYKIVMIQKFVRYQLLGYRPYQHRGRRISVRMNCILDFPKRSPSDPSPAGTGCSRIATR